MEAAPHSGPHSTSDTAPVYRGEPPPRSPGRPLVLAPQPSSSLVLQQDTVWPSLHCWGYTPAAASACVAAGWTVFCHSVALFVAMAPGEVHTGGSGGWHARFRGCFMSTACGSSWAQPGVQSADVSPTETDATGFMSALPEHRQCRHHHQQQFSHR